MSVCMYPCVAICLLICLLSSSEWQDGIEGYSSMSRVERGLAVVQTAVDLMNNNKFKEAQRLLQPRLVSHWGVL